MNRLSFDRLTLFPHQPTRAEPPLGPGDEVDVWCRSLGTWSTGFVSVDCDDQGWRVMRNSDHAELPVRFTRADVRVASH